MQLIYFLIFLLLECLKVSLVNCCYTEHTLVMWHFPTDYNVWLKCYNTNSNDVIICINDNNKHFTYVINIHINRKRFSSIPEMVYILNVSPRHEGGSITITSCHLEVTESSELALFGGSWVTGGYPLNWILALWCLPLALSWVVIFLQCFATETESWLRIHSHVCYMNENRRIFCNGISSRSKSMTNQCLTAKCRSQESYGMWSGVFHSSTANITITVNL